MTQLARPYVKQRRELDLCTADTSDPSTDYSVMLIVQAGLTYDGNLDYAAVTAGGVEATFPGYARVVIQFSSATTVGIVTQVVATAAAMFTPTGLSGQLVYAYAVINTNTSALEWAVPFDTPVSMDAVFTSSSCQPFPVLAGRTLQLGC